MSWSGHWRWPREHGHCAIQNHLRALENGQEFLETIQTVHITNCGQLPSKEMSSINNIAKGYSDLEIEAGIVVQVVWCWTKQVTFLSVSFLYIKHQSVQFSHSVMSNSLRPHGLQHARPPCPSPTPRVYSNSCALSQWCHQTISSSAIPFSSHLQSFPASRSFSMSQFFASGCQSIGISASASVLPMNIQDWFPLGWIGWISLQSKGLSVEEEKKKKTFLPWVRASLQKQSKNNVCEST